MKYFLFMALISTSIFAQNFGSGTSESTQLNTTPNARPFIFQNESTTGVGGATTSNFGPTANTPLAPLEPLGNESTATETLEPLNSSPNPIPQGEIFDNSLIFDSGSSGTRQSQEATPDEAFDTFPDQNRVP